MLSEKSMFATSSSSSGEQLALGLANCTGSGASAGLTISIASRISKYQPGTKERSTSTAIMEGKSVIRLVRSIYNLCIPIHRLGYLCLVAIPSQLTNSLE
jgi:hypothetical protein